MDMEARGLYSNPMSSLHDVARLVYVSRAHKLCGTWKILHSDYMRQ